jgi:class 3 adenylate cyclase/predicted ATPase
MPPRRIREWDNAGEAGERMIMDLGCWLRSLGLGQYEDAFRENAIDSEVLPALTVDDLKDLGVTKIGHRRRLLDAIAALRVNTNLRASSPNDIQGIDKQFGETGERRHVTVLFCDLVGSTALAAKIDPEDLREMLLAYRKCVTDTVDHLGGYVAQYMGDGVLVYFGFPQAHEDDAERAVRTGLELIAAVSAFQSNLQIRVGIASGLVVVGDLIGHADATERGIVGDTPNLAARLQAIADPNMVVIADGTRRLLGNLFELKDLGPKSLKGIDGLVQVWAALRPSSFESRFEALHATALTALVGRQEELELLLRRWSKAKNGEGRVVLLSGEPGIGKSRLTAALLERLTTEPHTRLRYFCSPQHTDSALYPIIGQMERAAGLVFDDHPKARLDKLDAVLAQTSTSIQDAALFAEMLSLQNDGRYRSLELLPEQRRQKTLDALVRQAAALARQKPVLMIFEDAHWADPTSLEALGRVVDQVARLRTLLTVTFRPEFEPPWTGLPHVTTLTLSRLGPREVNTLIDCVAAGEPLPINLRQDVAERCDGIPLFVEEMTKAALEAEGDSKAQRTVKVASPLAATFPLSLHASLMARLDRLGPAKEVAQIGAAIGREFHHALLAAVARKPEAELGSALSRLIAAGLLFRQGAPPHAAYLFKHALVRDAAYGTLLREARRTLHARIAETLESQFTEIAESQPELLARHYTEAGLIEKAAGLWGKAGQRSLDRSALIEAAAQFIRALDQIATLPETPRLRSEEIKLQVSYANTLIHVNGYAAPETKMATERAHLLIEKAEALGEPPENPLLLFSVLYGFWAASYVAFNGDMMLSRAKQFLTLAQKHEAVAPLTIAHRIMGISQLCTGDIAQGRAHFDKAIALYDPVLLRPLATRFSVDAAVSILSYRSLALWALGFPDAALKDAKDAVSLGRETGLAASLMYAWAHAAIPNILCGCHAEAAAQTKELLTLAEDKGTPHWKAFGMMNQGWLMALTGGASDAVPVITSGIALWRSTEATHWIPLRLSYLAAAQAELGQIEEAQRSTTDAIAIIEATKERWCEAEVQRVAGEIALKSPKPGATKAEAHFERALAVARAQQAKSWELRAAMSMARLWRVRGERHQARELIGSVYSWFTEGFDTFDLTQAKSLLEELA